MMTLSRGLGLSLDELEDSIGQEAPKEEQKALVT